LPKYSIFDNDGYTSTYNATAGTFLSRLNKENIDKGVLTTTKGVVDNDANEKNSDIKKITSGECMIKSKMREFCS